MLGSTVSIFLIRLMAYSEIPLSFSTNQVVMVNKTTFSRECSNLDLFYDLMIILAIEWRLSSEHAKEYNTQTPNVALLIVFGVVKYLRSHIIRSAHNIIHALFRTK